MGHSRYYWAKLEMPEVCGQNSKITKNYNNVKKKWLIIFTIIRPIKTLSISDYTKILFY